MNNLDPLINLMSKSEFLGSLSLGILAHYVVLMHIVGGCMIAAGLLTRLASRLRHCLKKVPKRSLKVLKTLVFYF